MDLFDSDDDTCSLSSFYTMRFATLLDRCLHCIKKGSTKESLLASHVIGLLALTAGLGDQAQEILEESVVATKPSPAVITTVVSSWTCLLTTVDRWTLGPKILQGTVTYLSTLLEKDDRSVRIAAGEALALMFELGILEKFDAEVKGSDNGSVKEEREALINMHRLISKVTDQVRDLAVEAGGKGCAKKDLNTQRSLFKDLVEFLEDGVAPETSIKIGGSSIETSTWCQMIQLNFLKHFLGGGFIKHMQENEFLHDVFSFTPKKIGGHSTMTNEEKRLFQSPNSAVSKARTKLMKKERMISLTRKFYSISS
ncbi:hypothetical protein HID58_030452 [Brassica napus]|uniref:Interferon-related developmental regulator N-terminal domain-containing protein n=1 Tax=Brassica napus TaxID=3708 RepID=A0ABQ8CFZ5_BRANA|nr:hypothetical protein HID58_030452 [Brassica napus]